MSGRKSWEVANVLSEVEKAQEDIIKNYQNSIDENLEVVDDIKKEMVDEDIDTKIEAIKDENLKKEFKNYEKFFKESAEIKKEFADIIKERDKHIKRAQELRNIIKNKQHYATDEYNEAVKIKKSINECKTKLSSLKDKSEKLKHQVIKLRSFIENVENLFEAKKEYLEELFDDILNKLNSEDYILIEDIAEKKDNKISKIEYFDHYNEENNYEKFKSELDEIESLIEKNEFDEVENRLETINKEINKISNEVDKMKEDMESALLLSLKIRDIMLDKAGFSKAKIELIDGNPLNGFKIYTQNGDTINFEEVKVNDGEVTINLDHIERASAGCGVKWKELKDIFNKEGIPITDVTKNGYSVVYGGTKTKANGQTKEKVHK